MSSLAWPSPLTQSIRDAVAAMGHAQMTPVQAATIPLFMQNKDVVVEAVTGSGKTLAFVIPILEKLIRREIRHRPNQIGALIITPTRELATQIHAIFQQFLSSQSGQPPPALLLVSSDCSSPANDVHRFLETAADIVVGTPGRVEEFLLGNARGAVNVKELDVLVLDEADRLLDLGFQATLTRIITHLPKQRRTGLFSATMTDADALSELVRVGLRNPARVVVKVQSKTRAHGATNFVVEERRIPANLQNFYLPCSTSQKLVQLIRIINHEIKTHSSSQFIIYFATCACVDYFYRLLPLFLSTSTSLHSLHGNLQPSVRTRTLHAFASSISDPAAPNILLATDVAARGLDLPHVDVVVQFDPPTDTKAFSHRCGRTARAGRSGRAWVLLCGREVEYVDLLSVRKIPIVEKPPFDEEPEDNAVEESLSKMREYVLKDRARNDMAMKAFVSFVRAYSKHEASYIFRVKDLDLIGLAKSFGLLRLPRMPELKTLDRSAWTDADVDWDTYPYPDPAQESKRLLTLQSQKCKPTPSSQQDLAHRTKRKAASTPWSEQTDLKGERAKRKEKKIAKAKWVRAQQGEAKAATAASGSGKRERDEGEGDGDGEDDWDELAREERLAKKVRKGEVSQATFDGEFADL